MDDLDEMNAYSKKAEEYFSFIYSAYCNGHFSDLTVESILGFFDCLSVKKGWHLGLRLAQSKLDGDNSYFYTYPKKSSLLASYLTFSKIKSFRNPFLLLKKDPYMKMGRRNFDKAIDNNEINTNLKGLLIEPSKMGAWQAYLLFSSPTIFPAYWHGSYISRSYIFSRNDDLFLEHKDIFNDPSFFHRMSFRPTVIKGIKDYFIGCYYWNEWIGLVYDRTCISMNDRCIESIDVIKHNVLIPYHSSMCL